MFSLFSNPRVPQSPAPADSRHRSSEGLSVPQLDRTVELLSDIGRRGRAELNVVIQAMVSSPEVREAVLAAVNEHPSLLESPKRRGAILEAMLPFAHEDGVRELAVVSLESPYLKNSTLAVSAACAIIKTALNSAELDGEASQLAPKLEKRILKVASRYSPGGGDTAAGAAILLVRETPLGITLQHNIRSLARDWFLARHQAKNPWLALMSENPSIENVDFIASIAGGSLPDPRFGALLRSLVRFPVTLHEVAITSTIVTVASRQICAYLKVPKVVSNAAIAAISVALVVGSKGIAVALKEDAINKSRSWERVEGIALLSAMRAALSDDYSREARRSIGKITSALESASRSLMQPPLVRHAASIALGGDVLDPIDLWNQAIASGEFSEATRSRQQTVRL